MNELSNSLGKIKLLVMGCMSSKRDINDIHSNIFNVLNVDDEGVRHSQGQLEVTDANLVLYQKGKEPVRWPLKCLRRYGFETNTFSFESGRRCKTGAGIYAFRCTRAEQLFNLLQSRVRNYHQALNSNILLRGNPNRQIRSNDSPPQTESGAGIIPPLPPLRRGSSSSTDDLSGPVYVNWKNGSPSVSTENPLNFALPKNSVVIHQTQTNENTHFEMGREYANIMENTLTAEEEPSVNYIVLDLNQSCSSTDLTSSDMHPHSNTSSALEFIPEGYATIDFDKTVALTKSANADPVEEPGVRKTRHNSTLSSSITQNMNLGIG